MPNDETDKHPITILAEHTGRRPLQQTNVNLLPRRPLSALGPRRFHEVSHVRKPSEVSLERDFEEKKPVVNTGTVGESTANVIKSYDGNISGPARETHENSSVPGPSSTKVARRAASSASLPLNCIPVRKSSASIFRDGAGGSRQSSIQDFPSWKLPPPSAAGKAIPDREKADSSLRRVIDCDPISSDNLRSSPSRTIIRTSAPVDILDFPNARHPRVGINTHLSSPLFVGGGTAEGHIRITVDSGSNIKSKGTIFIKRLSIDIIGVEEVSDGRRRVFLSLASELFDGKNPPPPSLVASQSSNSLVENKWVLKPASAIIPFRLNLPLNLGPPPYLSKHARIRYLICPTVVVQDDDEMGVVRQSWNVQMLTVHDPEKALSSLPSPLLASDLLSFSSGIEVHKIKLTAGLHRQTWVNGASIFVDIHIMNHSSKRIKRIELQLEKIVLWYAHAAATTTEKSASYLRLPRKSDIDVVAKSILKHGKRWQGVGEHRSEIRTMELEVPREHVTINTGRYFEIRYFVNVIVSGRRFKTLAVQLPVTIIHINSLDIVPNSLAQVAAAIEAKRARTVPVDAEGVVYPRYHQGQAFTAPRRQSLERARSEANLAGDIGHEEIARLSREIDESPRRADSRSAGQRRSRLDGVPTVEIGQPGSRQQPQIDGVSYDADYHSDSKSPKDRRNHHRKSSGTSNRLSGPKIPRLQLSTSGLGFSDSDFDITPDSPPRKVMLSESERKMIHQERELRLARQRSIAHNQNQVHPETMMLLQDGPSPHQNQHLYRPHPSRSSQMASRRQSQDEYQRVMMRRNHSVGPNQRWSHGRGGFGRSRSRTLPTSERDREHGYAKSFFMYDNPPPAQRVPSHRRWGWKNVAVNPGYAPSRPRFDVDGIGMNRHLEEDVNRPAAPNRPPVPAGAAAAAAAEDVRSIHRSVAGSISAARRPTSVARGAGGGPEGDPVSGPAAASNSVAATREFRRGFLAGRRSMDRW